MIELSILIPSLPNRLHLLQPLLESIDLQLQEEDYADRVEVLVLTDNKKRKIGGKREALKNLAQGTYFAYVDDDDRISADYVSSILEYTKSGVDIITFDGMAYIDGLDGVINMSLANKHNEQFRPKGVTKRTPWHVNAWNTKKFKRFTFDVKSNYGEDYYFCKKALKKAESEVHINKRLHIYEFKSDVTEAFN